MVDLVKFAEGIAELMWEDGQPNLDNDAVQELAEDCGIVCFRKPKPDEIADSTWFGHAMGIGPEDEDVGEFTPEFQAMLAALRSAAYAT